MARASPIQSNVNAGQLSPNVSGRVDIAKYAGACSFLQNFIPLIQGPAQRRSAFRFVAEVKDSTKRAWLIKFEFNVQQSYQLEFGEGYIRFFTNHGQLQSAGPYEIASPYTAADLTNADGTFGLGFVESADIIYVVCAAQQPRKLARLASTNWTLSVLTPTWGPFKNINTTALNIWASATTGAVTLNASAALFSAAMVGQDVYLQQKTVLSITQWEPGKAVAANSLRRSDGKNYKAVNAATTGGNKPIHSEGSVYDGDTGVQWAFQDPGYGYATITSFVSSTQVNATVVKQIPDNAVLVANATIKWAFSAWNSVDGYPTQVTFFKERLTFSRGQTVWLSVAGDYENMATKDDGGVVTTDSAIVAPISSSQVNNIVWMTPKDALLIGTAGSEFTIKALTEQQPFGPDNIQAVPISSFGSRTIQALSIGQVALFVQRSGLKMRDVIYDFLSNTFKSTDQTTLSDNIVQPGLVQIAYQQEPYSIIWAVRSDGVLAAMTYSREQYADPPYGGWHRHVIGGGGLVECISTNPNPAIDGDELWCIAKFIINGVTKRYVGFMEKERRLNDDQQDAFYVDFGLTLNNTQNAMLTPGANATLAGATGVVFTAGSAIFAAGDVNREIHLRYSTADVEGILTWITSKALITAFTDSTHVTGNILVAFQSISTIAALGWRMTVTTISGLSHLEGQLVDILADGAKSPQRTVSAGSITLQDKASKVHVGLPMPAYLRTMRLNAGAQDGTSQGKVARINTVVVRLLETLGLMYGPSFSQLKSANFRRAANTMNNAPPLFTGDFKVDFNGDYTTNPWLCFKQSDPLPCTIVAIMPTVSVYDRG